MNKKTEQAVAVIKRFCTEMGLDAMAGVETEITNMREVFLALSHCLEIIGRVESGEIVQALSETILSKYRPIGEKGKPEPEVVSLTLRDYKVARHQIISLAQAIVKMQLGEEAK